MKIIKLITNYIFTNPPRPKQFALDLKYFKSPYIAEEDYVDGFKLITVKKTDSLNKHFYFLHGGGYSLEGIAGHRKILLKLVDLGYKVTYISYPLWPEYTAEKTNQIAIEGYKQIVKKNSDDEFFFIGDSAGGGLAVSLLIQLRSLKYNKRPKKTILLSPWLDVSEENEQIPEYDKIDVTLPYKALKQVGEKYAGDLGPKHPFVSPIYGELNDLGEILMFYSESEIMCPDCQKFTELVNKEKDTKIETFIEKKEPHDFLMNATKEKNEKYFSAIKNFLEK